MFRQKVSVECADEGRRFALKTIAGLFGGAALSACGGGDGGSAVAAEAALGPAASNTSSEASAVVKQSTAANELRVSLPAGAMTNYPLQFGRAFAKGAVPGEPVVALDGLKLAAQQADVKTRYDDGSVKFAVISVVLPLIDTSERLLSITNGAAKATRIPERVANMLANYDFDATIVVAGATVSARAMLAGLTDSNLIAETDAGGVNSRYWTIGPVCTTVLLCDHTSKAWDVGTNATKAIRPMFHVQFWPGIGKYHVRHIIEVADVTKLKDETNLDVTFTTGHTNPVIRLSQAGAYVYAATFQTRAYWGGTDVPRANVKHGVAYLASTKAMPNYDPSISMNEAALASYASDWATRTKMLGSAGYWQKAMAATGGRPDLGLMPKWDVVAMYSGAAHMLQIAEENAELAGSWGFFLREGSSKKNIYLSQSGLGRVLSKLARPTVFWAGGLGSGNPDDRFTLDGVLSTSRSGWEHDDAHTPGLFWWTYLSTGAAFWHEKIQQMGAWSQFITNPGLSYNTVGNGRASTDLILNGLQPRAFGWQMRNRVRAWWVSSNGSPEASLFAKAIEDAVAMRVGIYQLNGAMDANPIYVAWNKNYLSWYNANFSFNPRPNALGYMDRQGPYLLETPPSDAMGSGMALWMQNYTSISLWHGVELGLDVIRPLAEFSSRLVLSIGSSSEPRHLGDYIIPDIKAEGGYYQSAEEMLVNWSHNAEGEAPTAMPASPNAGFPGSGKPGTFGVTVEGYGAIAAAAIAFANGVSNQMSAWNAVVPWYAKTSYLSHDPRYAIIPRVELKSP